VSVMCFFESCESVLFWFRFAPHTHMKKIIEKGKNNARQVKNLYRQDSARIICNCSHHILGFLQEWIQLAVIASREQLKMERGFVQISEFTQQHGTLP
jgi:hypothetical protein